MTSQTIAQIPAHKLSLASRNQVVARKLLFKRLQQIKRGCLMIIEGGEVFQFGESPDIAELVADIRVLDPDVYSQVVFSGSIGSGESYMDGCWSSSNLTQVIRLFVQNMDTLDQMDARQSWLGKLLLKGFHWLNRNSRTGSRKNISAHYDLGNDFFSLFLDPSLMYSAAIYPRPDASLAEASQYKLEVICKKLQLTPEDHLLEIGSGWGAMAIYAASHYGCRVTTTTISRQQYEFTCERVAAAGLTEQIQVLFYDYRDLRGQFSKLVSVEMIEAVGHEHLNTYFQMCSRLLKPDGLMLIQAITICDQRYQQARDSVDFIQRYIFPGGSLPSIAVLSEKVKSQTDMNIENLQEIGADYAQTLQHWRQAFMARLDQVRAQGFDERFIRMWEFYLSYCEGGFIERSIGTIQLLLAKPNYRSQFFRR